MQVRINSMPRAPACYHYTLVPRFTLYHVPSIARAEIFPKLKYLHIEAQSVHGRRWSLPQTPENMAAEDELNMLLERDNASLEKGDAVEPGVDTELASREQSGLSVVTDVANTPRRMSASVDSLDLGGSPSPSPASPFASPVIGGGHKSASGRPVINRLELPGPCPLTHLHLVSTYVQVDDVAVVHFRQSFAGKIRYVESRAVRATHVQGANAYQ